MTVKEKLALMRAIELRNRERLRKAGLLRKTEREDEEYEKSA